MEPIEPGVDRRKVIKDCGIDGGVESYQTVEDEFVAGFLKSLGLSHLIPPFAPDPALEARATVPDLSPVMPLTGICDNCG
jgi:hypothetical protein